MSRNLELTKLLLADLVAFPVISGMTNLDLVNYIVKYLDKYGIKSQLVTIQLGKRLISSQP